MGMRGFHHRLYQGPDVSCHPFSARLNIGRCIVTMSLLYSSCCEVVKDPCPLEWPETLALTIVKILDETTIPGMDSGTRPYIGST